MSRAYNWRKKRIRQGRYESPWDRHVRVMVDFSAGLQKVWAAVKQDPTRFVADP